MPPCCSCSQCNDGNNHRMKNRKGIGARVALALLAAALACSPAAAAEPFYKGKTISLIIGSNTSGGYDTYGRLLARHMGKHIAGHPTFVVQNMPGAGGLRSANHLYNVAAKDGAVMGIFDQAVFLDQLLGAATLRGDVEALSLPWSVLQAENPEWLRDKKINLILQTGIEKNRTLPDLPRMVDLARNENDRKVLEIFATSSVVGRSFVAPPGVPKERVDELRTAFMATVKDADFLADIAKLNFDLEPMAGAELQAFIAKDYPPALIERAREIARRN